MVVSPKHCHHNVPRSLSIKSKQGYYFAEFLFLSEYSFNLRCMLQYVRVHNKVATQKCKQNTCTLVWSPPPSPRSNPNTQPISACDISQERKQIPAQFYYLLFLSRGYTLRVIIEWIYCIVTFFAHCIYRYVYRCNTRQTIWRLLDKHQHTMSRMECTVSSKPTATWRFWERLCGKLWITNISTNKIVHALNIDGDFVKSVILL